MNFREQRELPDDEARVEIIYPIVGLDHSNCAAHGYNVERLFQQNALTLDDFSVLSAHADDTKRFDNFTLMGLDK